MNARHRKHGNVLEIMPDKLTYKLYRAAFVFEAHISNDPSIGIARNDCAIISLCDCMMNAGCTLIFDDEIGPESRTVYKELCRLLLACLSVGTEARDGSCDQHDEEWND